MADTTKTTEDLLKKLYADRINTQKSQIKENYDAARAELDAQQKANAERTKENLALTETENQNTAFSNERYYEDRGLTAGAKAMAGMGQANQLQASGSALKAAQQQADLETQRQKQLLGQNYQEAIKQAQAKNDIAMAEALYERAKEEEKEAIKRQEEEAEAEAEEELPDLYGDEDVQSAEKIENGIAAAIQSGVAELDPVKKANRTAKMDSYFEEMESSALSDDDRQMNVWKELNRSVSSGELTQAQADYWWFEHYAPDFLLAMDVAAVGEDEAMTDATINQLLNSGKITQSQADLLKKRYEGVQQSIDVLGLGGYDKDVIKGMVASGTLKITESGLQVSNSAQQMGGLAQAMGAVKNDAKDMETVLVASGNYGIEMDSVYAAFPELKGAGKTDKEIYEYIKSKGFVAKLKDGKVVFESKREKDQEVSFDQLAGLLSESLDEKATQKKLDAKANEKVKYGVKNEASADAVISAVGKQNATLLDYIAEDQSQMMYNVYFNELPKDIQLMTQSDYMQFAKHNDAFDDDELYAFINNPSTDGFEVESELLRAGILSLFEDEYLKANLHQMEETEVAAFNYLYAKEGEESAKAYLKSIAEQLNKRDAQRRYEEEFKGNHVTEILYGFDVGAHNFGQGVSNAVFSLIDSGEIQPYSEKQILSQYIRGDLDENLGGWGTVPYDVTTAVGQMLPSMALNMAIPGVGSVSMGVSAYGNAYQAALRSGYSNKEAYIYATLVGISEAVMEHVMGATGSGMFTNSLMAMDNAFGRLARKLAGTKLGKVMIPTVLSATSEGFEEGIQGILEPIFKSIVAGEEFDLDMEAVFYEAVIGFLAGLTMSPFSGKQDRLNLQKIVSQMDAPKTQGQTSESAGQNLSVQDVNLNQPGQAAPQQAEPGTLEWVMELAQLGQMSNNQAQQIVDQPDLYQMVLDVAGMESPSTQAGKRNAVKQAMAQIGQQQNTNNNQINIDNANNVAYNNSINGGEQIERTAGIGEDQRGVPGVYANSGADGQGRRERSGVPVGAGLVLLSPSSQDVLKSRGVVNLELYDSSMDNAAFSVALDNARNADATHGWAVTPKTAEDLTNNGVRTFMTADGSTGFAIAKDGDIEAVFANKAAGAPKGSTKYTIPLAIANGGTKLDCYGAGLVRLYAQYGFIPVVRTPFNPEYANPGWTTDKGNPDIYFMMHNGEGADAVVQNYGQYHIPTKEELDALPVMEYDDAYSYRDSLLQQQMAQQAPQTAQNGQTLQTPTGTTQTPNAPQNLNAAALGGDTQTKTVNPDDSVGAAPAGFSLNNTLQYQYGTLPQRENAVRSDDLPVRDVKGGKISEVAVNVKGARITSDEFVPLLDRKATGGTLSYIPITNDATTQKAIDYISERGWVESLGAWKARVENGEAGAEMTAIGAVLLNNAAQAGDKAQWLDILGYLQDLGTNTAQGLQAFKIIKQLDPSDKLYMIKRSIEKMNAKISKEKRSWVPKYDSVQQWMQKTGDTLAERLKAAVSTKSQKAQTVSQTVLRDLQKLARKTVKTNTDGITRRSDFDLIRDMLANKENYQKALTAAKETVQKEYGNDPAVMNALSEWMKTELDPAKMLLNKLSHDQYKDKPLVLSDDLAQEFLNAQTDEEADAVLDKIAIDLARQTKSTWMQKWNALRYMNMLSNFRTQGRNIIGNIGSVAMAWSKYEIATGLEIIANKVSRGKVERTKSAHVSKAERDAALATHKDVEKLISNGGRYNDLGTESDALAQLVRDHQQIFGKYNPLEYLRRGTNWAMEHGDAVFSKRVYARALAGYLKAKGITETDYSKIDQKVLADGMAYAIREAQEVTFRNDTWLSKKLSKLGRGKNDPKLWTAITEGFLPFRKTPVNVMLTGFQYNPFSGTLIAAKDTWRAFSNRKADVDPLLVATGKSSVTTAIESWAKALTGGGMMALGMWLYSMGFLNLGDDEDDDKRKYDDMTGRQQYSLNIGGYTYTIDWISPASIPLLMGGELMRNVEDGGFELKDLGDTFLSMADPLIETSMLSGVNDLLGDVRYSDNQLLQVLVNLAMSYLTQGLTNTMLGQIERGFEDSRMTTYVDKDSDVPEWLQKFLGKASAKTPVWDYQQIPYINAWGEEEENMDTVPGLAYNMLSPGYLAEVDNSALTQELYRLNEVQGENVFPSTPGKTISYTDEQGNYHKDEALSADQYVALAKTQGQTQKAIVEEMIRSDIYQNLDDEFKAYAIKEAYAYAREYAKTEVIPGAVVSKSNAWTEDAKDDPAGVILQRAANQQLFSGIVAQKGYEKPRTWQKIDAIANADDLMDDKAQTAAMKAVLSDGFGQRYDKVRAMGYDNDDFATVYKIYTQDQDSKDIDKDDAVRMIMRELKISKASAEKLYKVYTNRS